MGLGERHPYDPDSFLSLGQPSSDGDLAPWPIARHSAHLRRGRAWLFGLGASRSRFINWTGGTRYNILNKGLTSILMNPGARPGLSFGPPRAIHHRAHRVFEQLSAKYALFGQCFRSA